MENSHRHRLTLLANAALGGAVFAVGPIVLQEPLGIAIWSVVVLIVVLPLALGPDGLNIQRYVAACVAIVIGALIFAGLIPVIVLVAVAWSLLGGIQMLAAFRLPATLAIAATMLGAALSFTWPIWMASILYTYDLGSSLQRTINVSPAFALNAAIAPDDPLTHRPLAYRLMNLGQDVDYSMPRSVWPCVMLHAGVGAVGLVATRLRRPRPSS